MKSKKIKIGICSSILVFILIFAIAANYLCLVTFDRILTLYFKAAESTVSEDELDEELKNLSKVYYEREYKDDASLLQAKYQVCSDVAQEGYVLLKNSGDALPLKESETVSLWGWGSYNYMYIGTGTASAGGTSVTLLDGLKSAGISVNEQTWNAYVNSRYSIKGKKGTYTANVNSGSDSSNVYGKGGTGVGSIKYANNGEDWTLFEIPYATINSGKVEDIPKRTVAVYTIVRMGGEGCDLARSMESWVTSNHNESDKAKHYLQATSVELEMLEKLNNRFDKVIVLVNSNNIMELTDIEPYADAIVWAPGGGNTGTKALGNLLIGKDGANFSGRTVDTFAYDSFSSPAMQNFGEFRYYQGNTATKYYTIAYKENIYVGYRYYETRYEDAVLNRYNAKEADVYNTDGWTYSSQVQYPFGYGLSYTQFTWSDFVYDNEENTVSVTVTNTGEKAGKEVVQLYYQSEYTQYDIDNDIEKSAVNLLDAIKTKTLAKGESETVVFEIELEDLRTYDAKNKKTYILDTGDYYFTAASDAHQAINNILAAKGKTTANGMDANGDTAFVGTTHYTEDDADLSKDSVTDTEIENQFDYQADYLTDYLSRSNWSKTYPTPLGNQDKKVASEWSERNGYMYTVEVDSETLAKIQSRDTLNPDQNSSEPTLTHKIVNGTGKSDVQLIDLRGRDYDDPLWEDLLDKITIADMANIIPQGGWGTAKIDAINKPKTMASDGPTGLNDTVGLGLDSDITLPAPCLLAATYNPDLAYEYGKIVGEDSLRVADNTVGAEALGYTCDGWYAPSMNLHRTPFGGRNFEYYSEDPVVSGMIAVGVVRGAASKGMVSMIKHFALNENETERKATGLVSWTNEQGLRELYLVPFESSVKDSGTVKTYYYATDANGNFIRNTEGVIEMTYAETPACLGVMSSFVRIGATWTGGNYNLITNVLRNEWGFKGYVITDTYMSGYMSPEQIVYAGGTIALKAYGKGSDFSIADETTYAYARQAMKDLLYGTANSSAMNGYIHGVVYVEGFAYYKLYLIALDVALAAVAGVCVLFIVKNAKKIKKRSS